jgi:hypothetical protein
MKHVGRKIDLKASTMRFPSDVCGLPISRSTMTPESCGSELRLKMSSSSASFAMRAASVPSRLPADGMVTARTLSTAEYG